MRDVVPERLTLSAQRRHDPDAVVTIDEDTISRTDVHRELFHPKKSALPELLLDAVESMTPFEGGQSDVIDELRDRGIDALDDGYSAAISKAVVQENRPDPEDSEGVRDAWLAVWYLSRQLPTQSVDDVFDGPVALLRQLDRTPEVEVQLPSQFVSDYKHTQRTRLIAYLRRLTPGVNVYITGSRPTIKRLLDHHVDDLPADVAERAQTKFRRGSPNRTDSERVAEEAIESIGLTERQESKWALLTRACEHVDGRVAQADLQDDLLLDLDASTIRGYTQELAQHGLIEKDYNGSQVYLEPTAAGQAALSLAESEAPSLVGGWSTGDTPSSTGGSTETESAAVEDPPNSATEPCTPNACEGGEDGDRKRAEGQAVTAGGSSGDAPDERYLYRHEHHGAAAAVPDDGGIAFDERSVSAKPDAREVGWSLNETRDEVVVDVEAHPTMAFTAVRLCTALLSDLAERDVLTPAKLNGGPDKFNLDGLAVSQPYLLRAGRTLGWLKNADAEGKRFLNRLRQARNELTQSLTEAAEAAEGGPYDEETLSQILKKAHGLQGVLVALYDLLGYDVVRRVRIPEPWRIDEDAFAHFVLHATACSSRYGLYTAFRYLYEDDENKREDTLDSVPEPGLDDYRGTISGSWTVVGSDMQPFKTAVEMTDVDELELQDDAESFFDFALDLDVVDANRREAVEDVVRRLGPGKNLRPNPRITTLLHTLTGSTAAAAATITPMGKADQTRQMDHGDLEYGLSQLVIEDYDRLDDFDHRDIVPEMGGPTVSKVVAALCRTDGTFSTSEVAEMADVSTQSLRNDDNREAYQKLEALGFLEIEDGDSGCADRWSFSFPDVGQDVKVESDDEATAVLVESILGKPGWAGADWRIDEAIHEFLIQLVDDAGVEVPVSLTDESVLSLSQGTYDEQDVAQLLSAVGSSETVRLFATMVVPDVLAAKSSSTVRLGRKPAAAVEQQTLTAAAAD